VGILTKPLKIAVKAILFHAGKVLILRRSPEERKNRESHLWDFPGGSVEPEEQIMTALTREVKEETGLEVKVIAPAYVFDEIQEERHLVLLKFACDQPVGEIQLSTEHDLYLWVPVDQLAETDFPVWMIEEIRRAYRIYLELRRGK
jgi:8-oxo-dGTP diphosphatase